MSRRFLLFLIALIALCLSVVDCAVVPLPTGQDLVIEGQDAMKQGDFTTAILGFQDAIVENPDLIDGHVGLLLCYAKLDSLDKALTFFESGLRVDSTNTDLYAGAAMIYSALNRDGEAVDMALKALSLIDQGIPIAFDFAMNEKQVRVVAAQSYYKLGQYPEAQNQIDRVAISPSGLNPGEPSSWRVAGRTYKTYREALLALIEGANRPG